MALLDERQETRIELGLDRVKAHLARLGSPQEKLRVFHVAGTNGKGSTCAMLSAVLQAAGYKTGLYISPHLLNVRERIQINGRPISKGEFAKSISASLAPETSKLTYFELMTVASFVHFAKEKCDVVVLETGLGGRLDATNVVEKPLASIITSIGFDHMALLGNTLGKIAGEKAGIAKNGVPLICAKLAPEAMRSVKTAATKAGAPLTLISKPWPRKKVEWSRGRQNFTAPFGPVRVSLIGDTQGMNAALAYQAIKVSGLPVSEAAFRRGLSKVHWPCRFEVRRLGAKTAILDGAHNPQAMENLARTWKKSPWSSKRALFIVGVLKDKDAREMLKPVLPFIKEAVAVEPRSPRALAAGELAKLIRAGAPRARVRVDDLQTAVRRWRREAAAAPTALVCGSFYAVGQAAADLGGR